jgi:NADH:ubiquinone oxidoreductase subunit K
MVALDESISLLVVGALALFWVGMLGLLWRRSLVGMLIGVLFGWLSVAIGGVGFIGFRTASGEIAGGGAFVLCAALVCALQLALGLSILVARIGRRGTLDAQDAELLEG